MPVFCSDVTTKYNNNNNNWGQTLMINHKLRFDQLILKYKINEFKTFSIPFPVVVHIVCLCTFTTVLIIIINSCNNLIAGCCMYFKWEKQTCAEQKVHN